MIEIIEFPSNPHLAGRLTGDQSHWEFIPGHIIPEGDSLWGTMLSYPILKDYQHWKSHYSLFLPWGFTI